MARTLGEVVKVRIDAATRVALEQRAAQSERSVGAVVRLAIRDYLARQGDDTQEARNG